MLCKLSSNTIFKWPSASLFAWFLCSGRSSKGSFENLNLLTCIMAIKFETKIVPKIWNSSSPSLNYKSNVTSNRRWFITLLYWTHLHPLPLQLHRLWQRQQRTAENDPFPDFCMPGVKKIISQTQLICQISRFSGLVVAIVSQLVQDFWSMK